MTVRLVFVDLQQIW